MASDFYAHDLCLVISHRTSEHRNCDTKISHSGDQYLKYKELNVYVFTLHRKATERPHKLKNLSNNTESSNVGGPI